MIVGGGQVSRAKDRSTSEKLNEQLISNGKEPSDNSNHENAPATNDYPWLSCGEYVKMSTRIINGFDAYRGQFPHQVRLQICTSEKKCFKCGGSIIDERHILSAAHCFKIGLDAKSVTAFIGDHFINDTSDGQQSVDIKEVILHEHYKGQEDNFKNDIALLITETPMRFDLESGYFGPVNCVQIPDESATYYDGEPFVVSGWGRIGSEKYHGILQYAHVAHRAYCNMPKVDTTIQICASGNFNSFCRGDSGGPLVREVGNRYELVGIVSSGDKHCGTDPYLAGVYTRVASYLDWIEARKDKFE